MFPGCAEERRRIVTTVPAIGAAIGGTILVFQFVLAMIALGGHVIIPTTDEVQSLLEAETSRDV